MTSLTQRFFNQAERLGDRPCFAARGETDWHTMSWREVRQQIQSVMTGLREAGIRPGDRVLLLSENRPEWAIFDLAIMGVGAIVVPAYVTHTVADLRHVLSLVSPRACLVSSMELMHRLQEAATEAPELKYVWCASADAPDSMWSTKSVIGTWQDLIKHDPQDASLHPAQDDDTCCLIFTSGTSGLAKAAMLSHRSIAANVDAAIQILERFDFGSDDRFLSFLPLAHAYEHTAGLHMPIGLGAEVYFCESTEKLQQYLVEVQPTVSTAVPRLYDLLYGRIQGQLKNASFAKRWLFHQTLALGTKRVRGQQLNPLEALLDGALDALVRKKVRERFGGRIRYFVSGGAALNPAVGEFFTALGVGIIQGYGQTEASPLISVNSPDWVKMDSVGRPFDGVEVKCAADGELLVRGALLMNGYWEDPKATDGTLVDGWLHTGDLGTIDADGFIRITGRKKDLIVTSGGENIAPSKIETLLASEPEIEQAVVFGDSRPWLGAVIVPTESLMQLADPADQIAQAIKRVNQQLSASEQVRKFVLQGELCTTENGLLTPTQKVRRHLVLKQHETAIQSLYRA